MCTQGDAVGFTWILNFQPPRRRYAKRETSDHVRQASLRTRPVFGVTLLVPCHRGRTRQRPPTTLSCLLNVILAMYAPLFAGEHVFTQQHVRFLIYIPSTRSPATVCGVVGSTQLKEKNCEVYGIGLNACMLTAYITQYSRD